ncbi:hypothetical protein TBLA_0B00960 [Henningerozyma blattae CBS 6284]|uniref:Ammonium transporter n=1 Tax=Henningerozyma blattae (strain ATCC 34711 / CBS 6284 / DSM 70876 / NBRC 10599 / NRRL Y-10934 / UCD 77-7) TaxID=1071380 RepID=I2GXT7_HENB6|nr:hypothetical protein TBLA_0B00960 [Tetrapisispora blattae CBS 6284]CCH58939.1 hypothetical protein TBLA_0B00960 [Tetrapisispora blattae CBS 6284]
MSYNFTQQPTTIGTGGDSLTTDLNTPYQLANMLWLGVGAAGVWLMVPGIGFFYSGLSRKKHALSLLWASLMAVSVVIFQWFFWGYSLAFSHNTKGHGFIGSLQFIGFRNVLGAPSSVSSVPDIVFAVFQGMFAAVTGALLLGGAFERARFLPMMIFIFIWITVVYCPIACWTWNADGWLAVLGSLDYAGGGPVHIASGHGALIYALILGKRNDPLTGSGLPKYKPHSMTSVVLGTIFLWFGWQFFNPGSAGNASIRAWYSAMSTNLAAACGGLTWMVIDYFRSGGKWTTVGLCSGILAGLVGITPAAGFVPLWASVIIGIITAIGCNLAVDLKLLLRIDDGLDVWALHGVGGCIGSVFTGIFAADYINATAGEYISPIKGGWINHHWKQVGYQLAAICSTIIWTVVCTGIILLLMNQIPHLRLRLRPEDEELGTDEVEIGEFTYEERVIYTPTSHSPESPSDSDSGIVKTEIQDNESDMVSQESTNDEETHNADSEEETAMSHTSSHPMEV